jgi:hypothetical protein
VDGRVVSNDVVRAPHARLDETITRTFVEKGLRGALLLDVAKAFDTVWVYNSLHRSTLFILPSYLALSEAFH